MLKYKLKRRENRGNKIIDIFECNKCGYTGSAEILRIHTRQNVAEKRKHPVALSRCDFRKSPTAVKNMCKGNIDHLI